MLTKIWFQVEQGRLGVATVYLGGGVCGALGASLLHPTLYLVGASAGVYALLTSHLAHLYLVSIRVCIEYHIDKWWLLWQEARSQQSRSFNLIPPNPANPRAYFPPKFSQRFDRGLRSRYTLETDEDQTALPLPLLGYRGDLQPSYSRFLATASRPSRRIPPLWGW